jgi:hypothetical protein
MVRRSDTDQRTDPTLAAADPLGCCPHQRWTKPPTRSQPAAGMPTAVAAGKCLNVEPARVSCSKWRRVQRKRPAGMRRRIRAERGQSRGLVPPEGRKRNEAHASNRSTVDMGMASRGVRREVPAQAPKWRAHPGHPGSLAGEHPPHDERSGALGAHTVSQAFLPTRTGEFAAIACACEGRTSEWTFRSRSGHSRVDCDDDEEGSP